MRAGRLELGAAVPTVSDARLLWLPFILPLFLLWLKPRRSVDGEEAHCHLAVPEAPFPHPASTASDSRSTENITQIFFPQAVKLCFLKPGPGVPHWGDGGSQPGTSSGSGPGVCEAGPARGGAAKEGEGPADESWGSQGPRCPRPASSGFVGRVSPRG